MLTAKGGAGYNLTAAHGSLLSYLFVKAADFEMRASANATLNGCQLTDGLQFQYEFYVKFPKAMWAAAEAIAGALNGMDTWAAHRHRGRTHPRTK